MKLKRTGASDRYFTRGKEYKVKDRYIEVEKCSARKFNGGGIYWYERHIRFLLEDDRGDDFRLGQYSYKTEDYFYGIRFWDNWEITDKNAEGLTFKGNLDAGKRDKFWNEYIGVVCGLATFGVVIFLVFLMSLVEPR